MHLKTKFITELLLMAALTIAIPVIDAKAEGSADGENNIYQGTTEESYKVTIPAEVTVPENTKEGTFSVNVSLGAYRNLDVTISSDNGYHLVNTDNGNYQLNYGISNQSLVFSNQWNGEQADTTYTIDVNVNGEPEISGEYQDHLSFTFEEKAFNDTPYKLTFDPNCAADETIITSATEKWVDANTPYGRLPQPKRDGYDFLGWYTSKDDRGKQVTEDTVMESKAATVYAHWNPHVLTINYHNDGADYIEWAGKNVDVKGQDVTKSQPEKYGCGFTNYSNGLYDTWRWFKTGYGKAINNTWKIGKTGRTIDGGNRPEWEKNANKCAEELGVLEELKEGDVTVDLYPLWKPNTYYVEYNAGCSDATGSTEKSTHTYDEPQNLTPNGFSREGYEFAGWATTPGTEEVQYSDEAEVENLTATNGETVILYAVWKKQETPQMLPMNILILDGGLATPSDADEIQDKDAATPSDADKIQDKDLATPSDADKIQDKDLATPSDADEIQNEDVATPSDADEIQDEDVATPSDADSNTEPEYDSDSKSSPENEPDSDSVPDPDCETVPDSNAGSGAVRKSDPETDGSDTDSDSDQET